MARGFGCDLPPLDLGYGIKGYHQAACCHCVAVMAFFGHITHFFGNRSQTVTRVMIRFRDLLHR